MIKGRVIAVRGVAMTQDIVRTKQGPHPDKKYVQAVLHIPETTNVGNLTDILGEK
jgi:hypothetical protein